MTGAVAGPQGGWAPIVIEAVTSGGSFLDVGCWEGRMAALAQQKGARAVGVDMCASPSLKRNVDAHGFRFLQVDAMGPRFLELEPFDVVLCAGVIYHVPDPYGLLTRMKLATKQGGRLFVESAVMPGDEPVARFQAFADNPSNWWLPTTACLISMFRSLHMVEVKVAWSGKGRAVVSGLRPRTEAAAQLDRVLPRHPVLMPGGERDGERTAKKRG